MLGLLDQIDPAFNATGIISRMKEPWRWTSVEVHQHITNVTNKAFETTEKWIKRHPKRFKKVKK